MAYFRKPVPESYDDMRRYLDYELRQISDELKVLTEAVNDRLAKAGSYSGDMDALLIAGVYRGTALVNNPATEPEVGITVQADDGWIHQTIVALSAIWTRRSADGGASWSAWNTFTV